MSTIKRTLTETYHHVTVFYSINDEALADSGVLLDADQLDFYDSNVTNSYDIELQLISANWSLESGSFVMKYDHQTTYTLLLTLCGNGTIGFNSGLGYPTASESGVSANGYNGDVLFTAEAGTEGFAVVTFKKKRGYHMSWDGWQKPTQKIT